MDAKILPERFKLGQRLTVYELTGAFTAIYGEDPPVGFDPQQIARALYLHHPARFEFEVDRLRGFAVT